jgi:hypothetical protein
MERRTFLQGAAASIIAARFGRAIAQERNPPQDKDQLAPTIIYNKYFETLDKEKINPLTAPTELLRQFGLPTPPSRSSPIYPLWVETFDRPLVYAAAESLTLAVDNQTNPRFQQAQASIATRYETSPNWSGAYVHPRNGNMLLDVSGTWRIPAINTNGGLSGVWPPTCSIWVGLDGQRLYINSSLPQIGTWQQIEANGTLTYFGWYQWWVRGQPPLSNLPLVPINLAEGDVVVCRVQASGPSAAVVSMIKLGLIPQFWSTAIVPCKSPFTGQLPVISGATAEWVVERPTVLGSTQLYQVPRFDPVVFTSCAAEEALELNSSTVVQNLRGARFIQLFEQLGDPQRISLLAKPRYLMADDRDAFRVDYIG